MRRIDLHLAKRQAAHEEMAHGLAGDVRDQHVSCADEDDRDDGAAQREASIDGPELGADRGVGVAAARTVRWRHDAQP